MRRARSKRIGCLSQQLRNHRRKQSRTREQRMNNLSSIELHYFSASIHVKEFVAAEQHAHQTRPRGTGLPVAIESGAFTSDLYAADTASPFAFHRPWAHGRYSSLYASRNRAAAVSSAMLTRAASAAACVFDERVVHHVQRLDGRVVADARTAVALFASAPSNRSRYGFGRNRC